MKRPWKVPDALFWRQMEPYRLGAVLVLGLLLVLLYALTQPINLRRHNALLEQFSQLQSDESRLGEAVLQLNFNLANNYDQVTWLMARMRDGVLALSEGEAAQDVRTVAAFAQQLQLLQQRVAAKQEVLEQFKSRDAVLKNSLLYLPLARDQLLQDVPANPALAGQINALLETLLINRFKGGMLERGNVGEMVRQLQHQAPALPAPARARLDSLLRHVLLIDQYERSMPGLVRALISQPGQSALAQSYARHFDHLQQRAAVYRLTLLLAALALLGYAARTFWRLRAQARSLQLAASVFANASEGITITDTQGTILDVNAAFTRLTGYERHEVLGQNPRLLSSGRQDAQFYSRMWQAIASTGSWQGEIWNRRKNGEIYPEWLRISAASTEPDKQAGTTHYVATFSDISQRKKDEAAIYQLAFYDPLTALPNRRLLMDRLRQILSARNLGSSHAALLFIDIDHFKTLNDLRGNLAGDQLLVEVARRLLSSAREGDTVARLGSDEFVVLLHGLRLDADAQQLGAQVKAIAEKFSSALTAPYPLTGFVHNCTCSIGISLCSPHLSAEDMLQHANTAMSQAKAAGRNTLRFFDPAMQSALEARAMLEADLRQAVELQQFVLYYQVQVNASGDPVGAEALVRWQHPGRGLVSPLAFIPLAEETGLIVPLGHWILQSACAQLKAWADLALTQHWVLAVNISARQLNSAEFVSQVETALRVTAIEPSRLKLEITESMLLTDIEYVISTMRQLKALGVSFALDDFGTGYSSLQYLKRLPLDQLKIDQSFVRDLATFQSDQVIVGTIVAMADSLGLQVIAEGVETTQQRELLLSKGCEHFQGYLFGKPVPIEVLQAQLA